MKIGIPKFKLARLTLLVAVILSVTFVLLMDLKHMIRTDPQKARLLNAAMPVETAPARMTSQEEIIGATGEVQQSTTVSLTAQVSGRVLSVPVDLGSIVQKGDLLVLWDDRLFQASFRSSQERAEKASVQLKYALRQMERLSALHAKGMGSAKDVEEAEIQVSAARLGQAEALEEKTRAQIKLESIPLRSPVTGVVLDRLINPGENTVANQPLLTLGALDHVLMVAHVAEDKIGSIYLGQSAEVTFNAYPTEKFVGNIVKIDPKTDPETHTFSVYIKLSNPDLRLKPGLTGFARIRLPKLALAIPSIAIMNPVEDHPNVFVVNKENQVHLREIKIGWVSQGKTTVLDGLREGEIVITVGQFHLRENDVVWSDSIHAEK